MGQRKRQRDARRRGRDPRDIDFESLRGSAATGGLDRILGVSGATRAMWDRWRAATPEDLWMLRKAIRDDWDVPEHVKHAIVSAIMAIFDAETTSDWMTIA